MQSLRAQKHIAFSLYSKLTLLFIIVNDILTTTHNPKLQIIPEEKALSSKRIPKAIFLLTPSRTISLSLCYDHSSCVGRETVHAHKIHPMAPLSASSSSSSLLTLLFLARVSGFIVAALVISWALLFNSSFLPHSSSHEGLIYAVSTDTQKYLQLFNLSS